MNNQVFKLFLLAFLTVTSVSLQAQVTIGSLSAPVNGALLDLKQQDTNGTANATKGMTLPRVALANLNSLEGTISNVTDAAHKDSHIGLTVYNTYTGTVTGGNVSPCVYVWNGTEWMSLCDNGGSGSSGCTNTVTGVTITSLPGLSPVNIAPGANVTLSPSVSVSGGTYSYQWLRSAGGAKFEEISGTGGTNVSSIPVRSQSESATGQYLYYLRVWSDGCTVADAVFSNVIVVNVTTCPNPVTKVVIGPEAQNTAPSVANLTINTPTITGGTVPYTYYWQRSGANNTTFSTVSGPTIGSSIPSFTTTVPASDGIYLYKLIVRPDGCTTEVESNIVAVNVATAATSPGYLSGGTMIPGPEAISRTPSSLSGAWNSVMKDEFEFDPGVQYKIWCKMLSPYTNPTGNYYIVLPSGAGNTTSGPAVLSTSSTATSVKTPADMAAYSLTRHGLPAPDYSAGTDFHFITTFPAGVKVKDVGSFGISGNNGYYTRIGGISAVMP